MFLKKGKVTFLGAGGEGGVGDESRIKRTRGDSDSVDQERADEKRRMVDYSL